jgi:hypothetical protein
LKAHKIAENRPFSLCTVLSRGTVFLTGIAQYGDFSISTDPSGSKSEVILKVGAEGGSVALIGIRGTHGWLFRTTSVDQTAMLLSEEDRKGPPLHGQQEIHHESDWVDSWETALARLDEYPWHKLYPLLVHPEFQQPIWALVQSRFENEPSERSLGRWRELCEGSKQVSGAADMIRSFDRALDGTFMKKLEAAARQKSWWADVLADRKLVIALRRNYLDVYWRGQRLFRVEPVPSGLKVTTHPKFLVDPKMSSAVALTEGNFEITSLLEKGFIRHYEGPATLAKMKSAAGIYSKEEKTGCHEIAVKHGEVIDCEIAFPGKVSLGDGGLDRKAPRIDLASLETYGNQARIVFWEAKHYNNSEIRARSGAPRVLRQLKIYKKYLSKNRKAIETSYTKVAENLVAIRKMGWKRELSPLIADVGTGKRQLTLSADPMVGLIIFGFDSAQRDDTRWKRDLKRLKKAIGGKILTFGNAQNIRLPP